MKMKKLKNVWLFLSFILMVAGMASCSTEDPTGVEVSREDIIGTWKVTANDWTNSEEESNRNDHVGQTLSVRSDGTASFRGESFNWTLSKGVLTLSDNRGRNIRVVILSYTEEEIQASYDCTFESEMYTEEGNYTFKRVKRDILLQEEPQQCGFFCRCGRTHVQYLVNICLDIPLLCEQV